MALGRPRDFDSDKALDSALKVFWRKGYEGATLPELTKAMGINRPSMYAAFGNKEALFRKAIERYAGGPACAVGQALAEPVARAAVERMLHNTVELITDSKNPRGCFMVQSALACGSGADAIKKELIKRRASSEAALRERFERAVAEGDLPAGTDTADLARFYIVFIFGMSVEASGGASADELRRAVALAMRAWPTGAKAR